MKALLLVGAGLALASASAQALPLQPSAPTRDGIVHRVHDIYIEPGSETRDGAADEPHRPRLRQTALQPR